AGGRVRALFFSARHVDSIDYEMGLCYESHILAHLRGRLRRRAEGGAGSGVLRPRLVTVGPGRAGTPPARHYDLAARSSLHGSGGNAGDGSAAPDRKSPRWSFFESPMEFVGVRWSEQSIVIPQYLYLAQHGAPWYCTPLFGNFLGYRSPHAEA